MMTQSTLVNEKKNVVRFFDSLVKDNYQVKDNSPFQLLLDSDEKYPFLKGIENVDYKVNYLINLLVNELRNTGRKISYDKIKDDLTNKDRNKNALIYQVLFLDHETQKLHDYFFVLDTKLVKLFCFRRQTDFSKESNRLLKVIHFLHNQLFKDFDEIYNVLRSNGFTTPFSQVLHIINEMEV